jgi:hypothetical protein
VKLLTQVNVRACVLVCWCIHVYTVLVTSENRISLCTMSLVVSVHMSLHVVVHAHAQVNERMHRYMHAVVLASVRLLTSTHK